MSSPLKLADPVSAIAGAVGGGGMEGEARAGV